jgi:uncharacterized ferritin-like protein (DUF455 family)
MSSAPAFETQQYRGVTLRADPAREACFEVVHQHYEVYMPTLEAPADPTGREGLHSLYNSEVLSLEIAAQSLVEFPDAPWELRLGLARHCWDESRHAGLLIRRLVELGGEKGSFPIINHEWNVVCMFESLVERIAVQNRTFEAGSIDSFHQSIRLFRSLGDEETAAIYETIIADEVGHARFGNEWVRRLTKDDPGNVMKIARAMNHVKYLSKALATQPGEVVIEGHDLAGMRHDIAVQDADRKDSGFTSSEIAELHTRDLENAARDEG